MGRGGELCIGGRIHDLFIARISISQDSVKPEQILPLFQDHILHEVSRISHLKINNTGLVLLQTKFFSFPFSNAQSRQGATAQLSGPIIYTLLTSKRPAIPNHIVQRYQHIAPKPPAPQLHISQHLFHPSNSTQTPLLYTGSSAPLLTTPLLSTNIPIHGPTTGKFLPNPAIVPKKSPNNIKIPYNSTKNPTNAHFIRIKISPAKKAAVPLSFCRRAKKRRVFCGPMIMVRPMRKRIYAKRLGRLEK